MFIPFYLDSHLQPLSGEVLSNRTVSTEENARLDVAANGIWGGRFERTFVDMRIFNPLAPSNQGIQMTAVYRRHEKEKRLKY